MEDKEIIIDGIDVSGCEHHLSTGYCQLQMIFQGMVLKLPFGQHLECNLCDKNCYYKQLKRLEAENAEIKTSYINFIAKLKREMITKDDIQDLKDTAKRFVEERNSLRKENAELKAYKDVNEDFKTAWEELKAENERLKEDYINLSQQKDLDNARWQKRCTDLHIEDKAKADKYWLVLQEIKEIAEMDICSNCITQKREDNCQCLADTILQLITKAESEEE